jgi:hypothetical protein
MVQIVPIAVKNQRKKYSISVKNQKKKVISFIVPVFHWVLIKRLILVKNYGCARIN